MSRSWVGSSRDASFRLSSQYRLEVDKFIEYAFSSASIGDQILCPCVKCVNQLWTNRNEVLEHLICDGILWNYTKWIFHGEGTSSQSHHHVNSIVQGESETNDVTHTILDELRGRNTNEEVEDCDINDRTDGASIEADKFERLIEDAGKELYPGCVKFTRLSFILRLYHIKCLCKMTDKALSMLLDLLQEALPEPNTLPKNIYETKKIIKDLGLNYNKIDVCRNDCMLYWKEADKATSCYKCGTSRYESENKKIPAKTLRHFPLIPRLQRLYMSSKTSLNMRWHHDDRIDDQRLRHPADGQAWKALDKLYPTFSKEPRNIRLGLASDGFNPFKLMSSKHSTWPVLVMPYNLPPWMCMKSDFIFLTLLIPGPQQPGNDIDIYLQPLIEELKELWYNGVETYDAYKKEKFVLKACLLWTINDFPTYAVLSGWSTKGALACPCCNCETSSRWLKYGRKHCYLGHRRFLPQDHRFRRDKRNFDGHEEYGLQPKPLSGNNILEQLQGVQFPPFEKENDEIENNKKNGKKRRRRLKQPKLPHNWKKKSILFDLPYWKDNLIRHNLDVMHIEKNVCESILYTLLDLKEKSKDNGNTTRSSTKGH
ncbi:uncharacterized protein LOC122668585 [Telopea speciosissima]|uniref:uncharacterized protein LOC122668585 n=1 Tax=Telopea speciosissima TaxID=54955 RepID=UPI001CC79033|nr:uncharacterized protein LOC122668585 [Telopea speciosissima]